jgi:phytanoyl-CoA hydroxylase
MATLDKLRLTDQTIHTYREQGFIHIPQVLSVEEISRYRRASEALLAEEDLTIWGASEEVAQVHYVEEAWLKSDALRDLALHPVITRLAEQLAGGRLRLYSSDILLKKPYKALPTMIHDDEPGLPLTALSKTLTAWVALVDIPVERGCLTFVPHSHLRPESERQIHMSSFAEARPMTEVWPDFRWAPQVTVPVRAGDVTFHHFCTVHMAGPNSTGEARIANGTIYMDEDAAYRPGVQDHYLTHLKPGQLLHGEKFPPLR